MTQTSDQTGSRLRLEMGQEYYELCPPPRCSRVVLLETPVLSSELQLVVRASPRCLVAPPGQVKEPDTRTFKKVSF